jgi:hypothetical protein
MFQIDASKTYYQTNTDNKSFIKMAVILKKMNVSNHLYMLALRQKELADVDPHDLENITEELAVKIAYECKINPWYFFREVVRVPASGGKPVLFKLNRANLSLIWLYYNNVNIFLTHPRQTGKTISTQTIMCHVIYVTGYNYTVAMVTKDKTLISDNVSRLKDIRDTLPPYMVNKTKGIKGDSDNKEGISYVALKNKYITFVQQGEVSAAEKICRGQTTATQHWDEFAYIKNNNISYASAAPAMLAAGANAKANGQPSCKIITTTAGYLDTKEGAFANKVRINCMPFHETFYDIKDYDTLHELIKKGSSNNMIYVCYSYSQLGFTEEWLEGVRRDHEGTKEEFEKDMLNKWLKGGDSTIVNANVMDVLSEFERDPDTTEFTGNYLVKWYLKENTSLDRYRKKPLVLGIDSSENVGNDFTALVIIDPYDMSVVGVCRCNETNNVKLATYISELMLRFPRMVMIPERKSTGLMLIELVANDLKHAGYSPARRIFNQYVQSPEDHKGVNIDTLEMSGKIKRNFGYVTASSGKMGRERLYKDTFMKTMEMNAARIYDSTIITEIRTLTMKNGRIDHTTGSHDDTLFAYLLACYFVYYAKNINMYGIDHSEFMGSIDATAKTTEAKRQVKIKQAIAELNDKIDMEENDIIKQMYVRKRNELRLLLDDDSPVVSAVTVEQKNMNSSESKSKKTLSMDDFLRLRAATNFRRAA